MCACVCVCDYSLLPFLLLLLWPLYLGRGSEPERARGRRREGLCMYRMLLIVCDYIYPCWVGSGGFVRVRVMCVWYVRVCVCDRVVMADTKLFLQT